MKLGRAWIATLVLGVVNATVLYVFEFIGVNGTEWLWNDVFRTDTHRWMVLPVAVVLSLVVTKLVLLLGEKRVVPPESELMAEMKATGPVTMVAIGTILAIGAACLLAGASLGPEASLMAFSAAFAIWLAGRLQLEKHEVQLLVLASVGALLVAFLASIIMVLVPLLLLLQQKQLRVRSAGLVLVSGLIAYVTIILIDQEDPGYGSLPALPHLQTHDYVVALVVGFVAAALAASMNRLIDRFGQLAKQLDQKTTWLVSSSIFGLVLGVLYFLGGESVQFSGSIGSHLLMENSAQYGIAALLGLVVVKLLATAWSKGTGLRGGLVFPSIYIGLALGLLIGQLNSEWGGVGALIGGVAGMLSAVTGSPVVAGIFLLAVIPIGVLPVALLAIIGTVVFSLLSKRLATQRG